MAEGKLALNLIPKEEIRKRTGEKFLRWVLTYGRYIIIGTEVIVLLAFLTRFKLDRDLKNLSDSVKEKQTMIESFGDLEKDTRSLQAYLATIKTLEKQSIPSSKLINSLAEFTPEDVTFSQLKISPSGLTLSATAFSIEGFASFLKALKYSPKFKSVSIERVGNGRPGIDFSVNLGYPGN